jgi:hypothetical protein
LFACDGGRPLARLTGNCSAASRHGFRSLTRLTCDGFAPWRRRRLAFCTGDDGGYNFGLRAT